MYYHDDTWLAPPLWLWRPLVTQLWWLTLGSALPHSWLVPRVQTLADFAPPHPSWAGLPALSLPLAPSWDPKPWTPTSWEYWSHLSSTPSSFGQAWCYPPGLLVLTICFYFIQFSYTTFSIIRIICHFFPQESKILFWNSLAFGVATGSGLPHTSLDQPEGPRCWWGGHISGWQAFSGLTCPVVGPSTSRGDLFGQCPSVFARPVRKWTWEHWEKTCSLHLRTFMVY